jgi:hypothetical protein
MNKLWGALLIALSLGVGFAQKYGVWTYNETVDLITDEKRSLVFAGASEYPEYARDAALSIGCVAGDWVVVFMADRYIGSAERVEAVYRVDAREPVSTSWIVLNSGEAIVLEPTRVPALLAELAVANRFVIRISPTYTIPLTYVIPTSGAQAALGALTDCN